MPQLDKFEKENEHLDALHMQNRHLSMNFFFLLHRNFTSPVLLRYKLHQILQPGRPRANLYLLF